MLHRGRAVEELANDGAPFHKQRALAEVDSVVFQRVPEDLQDVAFFGDCRQSQVTDLGSRHHDKLE